MRGRNGFFSRLPLRQLSFRLPALASMRCKDNGGEKGIRTPERVTPLTVFETAAFDNSAISPALFKSPITCHSFDVFQVNSVHERKKITFFSSLTRKITALTE